MYRIRCCRARLQLSLCFWRGPPKTYILFRERIDELRQHFIHDDRFRQCFTVIGQSTQRQGGGLLDRGNGVQQQRTQQRHYVGILTNREKETEQRRVQ